MHAQYFRLIFVQYLAGRWKADWQSLLSDKSLSEEMKKGLTSFSGVSP